MRKVALTLAVLTVLAQSVPMTAFADDDTATTTQHTKSETTYTNPVTNVLLLPVRLVTGVIGAPIGAVAGLFVGFAKGFNWPAHASTNESTTTTKTKY